MREEQKQSSPPKAEKHVKFDKINTIEKIQGASTQFGGDLKEEVFEDDLGDTLYAKQGSPIKEKDGGWVPKEMRDRIDE